MFSFVLLTAQNDIPQLILLIRGEVVDPHTHGAARFVRILYGDISHLAIRYAARRDTIRRSLRSGEGSLPGAGSSSFSFPMLHQTKMFCIVSMILVHQITAPNARPWAAG